MLQTNQLSTDIQTILLCEWLLQTTSLHKQQFDKLRHSDFDIVTVKIVFSKLTAIRFDPQFKSVRFHLKLKIAISWLNITEVYHCYDCHKCKAVDQLTYDLEISVNWFLKSSVSVQILKWTSATTIKIRFNIHFSLNLVIYRALFVLKTANINTKNCRSL